MKKISFLIVICFLLSIKLFAQESNKIRAGIDVGYAMPKGGEGLALGLEARYNLTNNMNIGVRFEDAFLIKKYDELKSKVTPNLDYLGTFDYYFNDNGNSMYAPFIGLGGGYYSLNKLTFDSETVQDIEFESGSFGGFARAGFEIGKFRILGTYNFIPSSTFKKISDKKEASFTINNSYFMISIGFFVGGGNWKKYKLR